LQVGSTCWVNFVYPLILHLKEPIQCSFTICGSQQEPDSSIAVYTAVAFLILSLLSLLQIKYQNSGKPFQTHGAIMLLFIVVVFIYAIALARISQLTLNTSYLPMRRRVCLILGAFACDLQLLILVPPFGWLILILCVCMFV